MNGIAPRCALPILAVALASCATSEVEQIEFATLAGMTCDDLAAEQSDVEFFRGVADQLEFDDEAELRRAIARVDQREAEIAAARSAQACSGAAQEKAAS